MKIKSSKNFKSKFLKKINLNLFLKVYFFFTLIIGLVLIFLFINTGIWENFVKKYKNQIYANGMINYVHIPEIITYKLKNYFIDHKKVQINISKKNQILLESNRRDILEYLDTSKSLEFKHKYPFLETGAKIEYEDSVYNARIRLKGDRPVHFNNKKKSSYKIKLKNNKTINFSNKFSLQKPIIRNYLHEWLFHKFLKTGGLVTIEYDFVDLYLNGDYQGFYAFEEGFGKILIEKNLRRNGPIFSLDEEYDVDSDSKIKFEVYDKEFWNKGENIELLTIANSKLLMFRDGELDLEDVFDLEKWAWFFAVVDIGYTYHGAASKSVKFYYNPTKGKFEPIGYDGHRLIPNYNHKSTSNFYPELDKTNFIYAIENKHIFPSTMQKSFFFKNINELNYNFYELYLNALKKITSKNFLNNFFKNNEKKINEITSGIYSDYYNSETSGQRESGIGIYYFDKNEYFRRAEQIKDLFSTNISKIFIIEKDNHYLIENNHFHNFNFSNISFFCGDKIFKFNNFNIKEKLLIKKEKLNNLSCEKAELTDKFLNKNYIKNINKSNYKKKFSILDKQKYLDYFYFDGTHLRLIQNETIINKDIAIPEKFTVKILEGQKIFLINNSFIISYSNFEIGGANQKVLISGYENNYGGGLIVYGNKKKNIINNLTISNLNGGLNNSNHKDKIIYGSLNFINTNVDLNNLKFINIISEDALNIISSTFSIKNSNFTNIYFDGIDIDFGKGNIDNLYFQNIKNDGIDLSGSNVKIDQIIFDSVGDKAISVGEGSNVEISKINVNNSKISIASKDNSIVNAKNVQSNSVKYPFISYKKKNEYGGGKLIISEFSSSNYFNEFVKDEESIIIDLDSRSNVQYNKKYKKIINEIIN
jgi:hypothetical protein